MTALAISQKGSILSSTEDKLPPSRHFPQVIQANQRNFILYYSIVDISVNEGEPIIDLKTNHFQ